MRGLGLFLGLFRAFGTEGTIPPGPSVNARITDTGNRRITDSGELRELDDA
jgi:hypothetical protein